MRNSLKEAIEKLHKNEIQVSEIPELIKAPGAQFVVRENSKKPGEPILVREDGKVGFPTMNSIHVKIGDTVRGKIQQEEENYFLFEVQEIID